MNVLSPHPFVAVIGFLLLRFNLFSSAESETLPGIGGRGGIGGTHPNYEPYFVIRDVNCILYLEEGDVLRQVVKYGDSGEDPVTLTEIGDEEAWVCGDITSTSDNELLESVMFADIHGDGFDIQSQIVSANVRSGEYTLRMSTIVLKPKSAEIIIPSDATINIEPLKIDADARKLAPSTGTLPAVMVRVIDGNGLSPLASKEKLEKYTFGGDDVVSAADQYRACSYNKVNIIPGMDGDVGVIDINIPTKIVMDETKRGEVANSALEKFKQDYNIDDYRLIMFCLPGGTVRNADEQWLAYAVIEGKYSYYNDRGDWCKSVSAKMHEIGHNMNLGHSGKEKGLDQSGLMGPSYDESTNNNPGFKKMCFNAAKNFQLGWYANSVKELDPINTSAFDLIGVDDYDPDGDDSKLVVLRLITDGKKDYYIGFNRDTGINSGVMEDRNRVVIFQKNEGGPFDFGTSKKIKSLGFGQSYTLSEYNGTIGRDIKIDFTGLSLDEVTATINVITDPDPDSDDDDVKECNDEQTTLELVILPDQDPQDIEWTIYEKDGRIVNFGDNYTLKWNENPTGKTENRNVCLDYSTEYKFTIRDSFGDGICCGRGPGYFQGIDESGNILFQGGAKAEDNAAKEYKQSYTLLFTTPDLLVFETEFPTSSPTKAPVTPAPTRIPTQPPTKAPTEQPISTQPPTEQPIQPISTQPPTEQPIPTQPPTEQPISTQPPTEQPISTQPPIEPPVAAPPPTEQPISTQAPIEPPVAAPPPGQGACENTSDKFEVEKEERDCKWVNRKKGQRCKKKTVENVLVKDLCPARCKTECLPCVDKRGKFKINTGEKTPSGRNVKEKIKCNNFSNSNYTCKSKVKGRKRIQDYCRKTCELCS